MMSGGKFERFWAKYGHMHGLIRTCCHDLLQQGWCCTLRIYFRAGNTMKHALGLEGFQIFLAGRIWWDTGGLLPGSDSTTDARIVVACSSGRASQQALRRHPLVLKMLKANNTMVDPTGCRGGMDQLDQTRRRYVGLAKCFMCSSSKSGHAKSCWLKR